MPPLPWLVMLSALARSIIFNGYKPVKLIQRVIAFAMAAAVVPLGNCAVMLELHFGGHEQGVVEIE